MAINNRNSSDSNESVIDLQRLFHYFFQGIRRFWLFGVLCILACAAAGYGYAKMTYVPMYEATASLIVTDSVSAEQTSGELTAAAQMGKTFSYIVKSDMLRNVVEKDLEVASISSEITASAVTGTNLLTISVQDADPQRAYDVLNSVLKNYPSIAEYVLGSTKIEIVQQSEVPTAAVNANDWFKMLRAGALIGVAIFCLVALLYALTRKTAGNSDDIQERIGAEFLGSVPAVSLKKRSRKKTEKLLVTQKNINQGFVESFRNLANRIEQDAAEGNKKSAVYMVTSAIANEGKTTVAMNLAMLLAQRHKKVLFVDGDLRRASGSVMLGFEQPQHSLNTLLRSKSTWQDAVQRYRRSPLFVLPAVKVSDSTAVNKILSQKYVEAILAYAKHDFEYVVIDTPPLGILADATNIASHCDGTILVARQDYAPIGEIQETAQRIEEAGGHLVGFVLNLVRNAGGYGYGYSYGYGYGYGKSYGYQYQDDGHTNAEKDGEYQKQTEV